MNKEVGLPSFVANMPAEKCQSDSRHLVKTPHDDCRELLHKTGLLADFSQTTATIADTILSIA